MTDSVGSKLREARTRRSLSLGDAEAATKIRVRYLQAIEDDEWDQLPGDTYARAFVRTYSRFLGLDGERLAEEQRRSRGAVRPGESLPRVDPRPRPIGRRPRRRASPKVLAALLVALLVAALLVVGLTTGGEPSGPSGGAAGDAQPRARPHVGDAVPVR